MPTLLQNHLEKIERKLIADFDVSSGSGHPTQKGTAREIFIREFLADHLSERVAVGSGELVDAASYEGGKRNQHDVVIYKREYPKIQFATGINAFFVESVVATIEVKSTLTKADLSQAILSTKNTKALKPSLQRGISSGYQPPSIFSYVVAYHGPASMKTVHQWISEIHAETGVSLPAVGYNRRTTFASGQSLN
jgi:hypothetical protein